MDHTKWISVADQLPSSIYNVLGHIIESPLVFGQGDSMLDIVVYNPKTGNWLQSVGDDDAIVKVSHWMNLPSKPQIDKTNLQPRPIIPVTDPVPTKGF